MSFDRIRLPAYETKLCNLYKGYNMKDFPTYYSINYYRNTSFSDRVFPNYLIINNTNKLYALIEQYKDSKKCKRLLISFLTQHLEREFTGKYYTEIRLTSVVRIRYVIVQETVDIKNDPFLIYKRKELEQHRSEVFYNTIGNRKPYDPFNIVTKIAKEELITLFNFWRNV